MAIRILALCGYSQNASIFAKQVRSALLGVGGSAAEFKANWSALPAKYQAFQIAGADGVSLDGKPIGSATNANGATGAEVVFVDPPVVLGESQLSPIQVKEVAAYAKGDAAPNVAVTRSWWTAPDRKTYQYFDNTVKYLHEYLVSNEPFDGVIGFSQGAAMAAALAALLEKPGLHPDFPANDKLKPLKFAIAVGGFKPRSEVPDFTNYFPLQTPVLHVVGKTDPVVSGKASKQLQDACPSSRVETHEGGHVTPGGEEWAGFLSEYINTVGKGGKAEDVAPLSTFGAARARL
ncbi:Dihydrofolate reductase [Vanrija pseudolonga]|uniref:Dihydrofolate reductase n=1 Tax=Vanrija pseudolonga TaxID=143232 RepID=A0AAF0Y3L4_9TREE|nr:Dihydrofolate reductase [Vanrija pseudolonga]